MISILNNSLERLTSNLSEPARKNQQGSELATQYFINDFHWRHRRNNGRRNKGSGIVLQSETLPSHLYLTYICFWLRDYACL